MPTVPPVFRIRVVTPALFAAALAWAAVRLPAQEAQPEKKPPARPPLQIHTFSDLLTRAELIVVAEVGQRGEYGVRLKILDILKGPPRELLKKWVPPEDLKRASKLLEQEAQRIKKPVPEKRPKRPAANPAHPSAAGSLRNKKAPPLAVRLGEHAKLPAPGQQGLFFLWDRLAPSKKIPLRYRLAHPQNLYALRYAAEVKLELGRRIRPNRRRYLRAWDARMAARLKRRRSEKSLRTARAGALERGLRLRARRPRLSIRADNTFDVNVQFENTRGYAQAVYDGPLSLFGLRLRKKGAPPQSALILRARNPELTAGLDPSVLAIVDATDFATVPKRGRLSKELHFDAKDLSELAALDGPYVLNVFYASDKNGKNLDTLDAAPWTGTLLSGDFELLFKRRVVEKRKP